MDQQLIAVIGATITLGVAVFGSMRSLRKEMRERGDRLEGALRAEMKASEGRLEGAISGLRAEMKEGDDKLEHAISGLRDEMTTGFMNVTERVARVEGVIEGMFSGVRQPRETPRQGAA